jgi:hypothetical protein
MNRQKRIGLSKKVGFWTLRVVGGVDIFLPPLGKRSELCGVNRLPKKAAGKNVRESLDDGLRRPYDSRPAENDACPKNGVVEAKLIFENPVDDLLYEKVNFSTE